MLGLLCHSLCLCGVYPIAPVTCVVAVRVTVEVVHTAPALRVLVSGWGDVEEDRATTKAGVWPLSAVYTGL